LPTARDSAALAAHARIPALPAFAIEIRPSRERVIVAPRGELDCATVARLQTAVDDLVATGWDTIVLDLRGLCFMDSTGLCLITRQTGRTDAAVQLIDGTAAVSRLFDLTGLRPRLPFISPHGPRNAGPRWLRPVSSDNRTRGADDGEH
jgi:anti-anti-sigma factor